MARLVGVEDVSQDLSTRIASYTRDTDEAVALPAASMSNQSSLCKNVAFKLDGSTPGPASSLFSDQLFTGVSVIALDPKDVAGLRLDDSRKRKAALVSLAAAIPSEFCDPDLTVGPNLDGDAKDCDRAVWKHGFDAASSCVGLYSAVETACPLKDRKATGFARAHTSFFLVCRAGAGVAAAQFLSRLSTNLAQGCTLADCLSEGGTPGAAALRRLSRAGERNRARILLSAAAALGLQVSSISDTAANDGSRGAICTVTCSANTLRPFDLAGQQIYLYASGCCDAAFATGGVVSSSSPCDGFVMLQDCDTNRARKGARVLSNEAHCCLPFGSRRLRKERDVLLELAQRSRDAANGADDQAHPDEAWVSEHFCWRNAVVGEGNVDTDRMPPPCLWNSFDVDSFLQYSRELNVSNHTKTRLRPEIVCVAGMTPASVRLIKRHALVPVERPLSAPPLSAAPDIVCAAAPDSEPACVSSNVGSASVTEDELVAARRRMAARLTKH